MLDRSFEWDTDGANFQFVLEVIEGEDHLSVYTGNDEPVVAFDEKDARCLQKTIDDIFGKLTDVSPETDAPMTVERRIKLSTQFGVLYVTPEEALDLALKITTTLLGE
jgi:hypothetical protein